MRRNRVSDPRSRRPGTVEQRRRWRMRPTLMALEDRRLLSTIVVNNNAVDDVNTTGTLRWAIAQANAATSPSAIEFELGSGPATVALLQGQLELGNTKDATTIYDGPGEGPVTISGNQESRVFQVDPNVTASISGLTITGGNTASNGAGLYNAGTTAMTDCTVTGNTAIGGSVTNEGGGIFNSGTLKLINSTLSGNKVILWSPVLELRRRHLQ